MFPPKVSGPAVGGGCTTARRMQAYAWERTSRLLKPDLRALVPVSCSGARRKLERIDRADQVGREVEGDIRHAVVVSGDVAEWADAFDLEAIGGVGPACHRKRHAGIAVGKLRRQ